MTTEEIIHEHYAKLGEQHIQATGGWAEDVEARKNSLEARRNALIAKGILKS